MTRSCFGNRAYNIVSSQPSYCRRSASVFPMMLMCSFSCSSNGEAGRCAWTGSAARPPAVQIRARTATATASNLRVLFIIDGLREGARCRILLLTGWRYRGIPAGKIRHPDTLDVSAERKGRWVERTDEADV